MIYGRREETSTREIILSSPLLFRYFILLFPLPTRLKTSKFQLNIIVNNVTKNEYRTRIRVARVPDIPRGIERHINII